MTTTLKQIIRLKAEGVSNRQIAQRLGVTRKTINKYVKRIDQLGLNYQDLQLTDPTQLDSFLKSPASTPALCQPRKEELESFMPYASKELKRVGVTRWNLWAEYKNKHPEGYYYSTFCEALQKWEGRQAVSMHQEHKAGDKLYVDYTGSKLQITDRESGEMKEVEVLVAVLGASQYTYVEASMSQKQESFIGSVENALIYFGGVPRAIVPDNLKSAVTKASKYEPFLNQAFEDFALHYETTILPARPNKPLDKPLAEGGVKIVYNRIFSAIRDEVFFSLQELNIRIRELLIRYNQILFQGRECSRESLFKEIDQPSLKALPTERYIFKKYALATVLKSSHVQLSEDKHYYSVHYKYLGEKVKLIYNASTVEIYHKAERIAFHQRHATPHAYTTVREHMPSKHNFITDWNPEYFLNWASKVGASTHAVIEQLLNGRQHPEQAYKSCVGILSFAQKFGKDRLNNACERALYYQCCNYSNIKNILDKGIDLTPAPTETQYSIPFHENIRGQEYYQ